MGGWRNKSGNERRARSRVYCHLFKLLSFMKPFFIILVLVSTHLIAVCQMHTPKVVTVSDSLNRLIRQNSQNTRMVLLLLILSEDYRFYKTDSSLIVAQKAIELSRRLHFIKGEVQALVFAGEAHRFLGEYPQALELEFNALKISRSNNDQEGEAANLNAIGCAYIEMNEYREGLNYLYLAKKINGRLSHKLASSVGLSYIGHAYEKMNMLDSALYFQQQAYLLCNQLLGHAFISSLILARLGLIQFRLGNTDEALRYYNRSLEETNSNGDIINKSKTQYRIAELYDGLKRPDSSLKYARLAFINAGTISQKAIMFDASSLMVKLYKTKKNIDSAFYYQELAMRIKDSLYGGEKFKQLQLLTVKEQQRQKEIQQEQEQYKNEVRMYALAGVLTVFLFLSIFLYRNNRHKQKANALLQQEKEKVESTLSELKVTQTQLIQSEKMASLGELTAGIAHEIQNPLNFINNFSEVNTELVSELKVEIEKGNIEEVKIIANDIEENEQKINHHGKRADAIVKGMLQHSRASSGKKEPTDINALADEYLRLSYHGLRAKDKDFNADFKTDFDGAIGKINLVPQDIGRVLLNLFNNAFYAVNERQKIIKENVSTGQAAYQPTASISTKKIGDKVILTVKDNGNGIPLNIVDKIFQPFFTTKPTGQGTGLGLSLSYDIIRAHGGEIKVETKEGEGAEFIIRLPTGVI
jgi:two-component system NtrC family sensor kinase